MADVVGGDDGAAVRPGIPGAESVIRGVAEAVADAGTAVADGVAITGGAGVAAGGAVGGTIGFGVGGLGVGAGVGAVITTFAGAVEVKLADFSPAPEPLVAMKE